MLTNSADDLTAEDGTDSEDSDAAVGSELDDESNDSLLDDRQQQITTTTNNNNNSSKSRDLESMRNSLVDIEQRLRAQRQMSRRPSDPDEMTTDQLQDEKMDLQSCLLDFEHMFGSGPGSRSCSAPDLSNSAAAEEEEKALIKDLYDRYRKVKRLVRRSSAKSEQQLELETIPEDEAIPLTLASPQHRINIEVSTVTSSSPSTTGETTEKDGLEASQTGHTSNAMLKRNKAAAVALPDVDRIKENSEDDSERPRQSREKSVEEEVEESLHSLSR
jgi:hypothetical protein